MTEKWLSKGETKILQNKGHTYDEKLLKKSIEKKNYINENNVRISITV